MSKSKRLLGLVKVSGDDGREIEGVIEKLEADNSGAKQMTRLTMIDKSTPMIIDAKTLQVENEDRRIEVTIDLPVDVFTKIWIAEYNPHSEETVDFSNASIPYYKAEYADEIKHANAANNAINITPQKDQRPKGGGTGGPTGGGTP